MGSPTLTVESALERSVHDDCDHRRDFGGIGTYTGGSVPTGNRIVLNEKLQEEIQGGMIMQRSRI